MSFFETSKYVSEPIIKVGIMAKPVVRFRLNGSFYIEGETVADIELTAIYAEGKIILAELNRQFNSIEFEPVSVTSSFTLHEVTIGVDFHWETTLDQQFEGALIIYPENDKLRVINSIAIEKYLLSVISSEMSAMNDLNLLNAHAVISRSWLLAQLDKRSRIDAKAYQNQRESLQSDEYIRWYDREDHQGFDVCADDHCQRYQGVTRVISENAQKAIDITYGKVLMWNNQICDARFSKCCGGITEDFENVWEPIEHTYLKSINDCENKTQPPIRTEQEFEQFILSSPRAFCNTTDELVLSQILVDFDRATTSFFRWSVEYTQTEISELIHRKSGIDFGRVISITPIERGKSGRIIKLKIEGEKRAIIVGKELEIRRWLSETHLFSSAFIVETKHNNGEITPTNFSLKGAGWGHGVGLCQIGAAMMSNKGYRWEEILEHYFEQAEIKTIYSIC